MMSGRFTWEMLKLVPLAPIVVYQNMPTRRRRVPGEHRTLSTFSGKLAMCSRNAQRDSRGRWPCTSSTCCEEVHCHSGSTQAQHVAIAVVGDVFVDVVAKVSSLPMWDTDVEADFVKVLPGGSALNGARHLHALGADVRFLGAIGGDAFGRMLIDHVSGQGFQAQHIKTFKALPSSVCIVLTGPKDRAMVSCYSSTQALGPGDLDERFSAIEECAHLHIGGYYNMLGLQNAKFTTFVRRCREKGMTVSMNTQYDASEVWTGRDNHLHDLLPLVDVLFVSGVEAAGIAAAVSGKRENTNEGNIESLCQSFPNLLLVVTRGAAGCDVVRDGAPMLQIPTLPCARIVDTTGAGDAFFAGFLSAWLPNAARSDMCLKAACLKGHAVAGICVGREGACLQPVCAADLAG